MATPETRVILTAQNRTGAAFGSVKRDFKAVEAAALRTGRVIGAAFAGISVAGLTAGIKTAIDNMDELSKASQKVNTTTEKFSALAYAAKLADIETAKLKTGLVNLSANLDEAKNNASPMAEAFRRLDIDPNKFKDPVDALLALSDRFAAMPAEIDKTALAAEIFGKKVGPDMLVLLNQGKAGITALMEEAKKLGIVIDTETGRAAEEFNDNLTRIKTKLQGEFIQAASAVLPVLVALSGGLADSAKEAGDGGPKYQGLVTFLKGLIIVASEVANLFTSIGRTIGGLAAATVAAAKGDFSEAAEIIKELRKDNLQAQKDLAEYQKNILNPPALKGIDDAARKMEAARENQTELRAEAKKTTLEQISDAKRLGDALRKAYEEAGKAAKDYFAQAAALRDRANARAVGEDPESQALATLGLIAAEQKLYRIRAEAPLEDVQRQAQLVRELADGLVDKARAAEAAKTADLAEADALEKAGKAEQERQKGLIAEQQKNQTTLEGLQVKLKELEKPVIIKVDADVTAAQDKFKYLFDFVKSQGVSAAAPAPAYADGGAVSGPGGPRTDSIWAKLSAGEHVLTAAEVQSAGGHSAIYALRNLMRSGNFPRFADGGAVGANTPINLTLPGVGSFAMQADESVAASLQKAISRAALMRGRRR